MKRAKGWSRNTWIFNNIVIKFPRLYCKEFFLKGVMDNLIERRISKKTYKENKIEDIFLAKTYFCFLGLILIAKKEDVIVEHEFEDDDDKCKQICNYFESLYKSKVITRDMFKILTCDNKPCNYAIGKEDGRFISIDYANSLAYKWLRKHKCESIGHFFY